MTIACIFGENRVTGLDEQCVVDPSFQSLVTSEVETYAKHLGMYFHLSGKIDSLAAAGSVLFLARIPAGIEVHVGVLTLVSTTAPSELQLFEIPTVTSVGTPITPINVNRNLAVSHPSGILTYAAPTVTANGLRLNYTLIAGSKQDGGLGNKSFDELILKPSTDYLFVITNLSVSAATMGYTMEWVERTL